MALSNARLPGSSHGGNAMRVLRRAKRGAFVMKDERDERDERAKRIGWVSLVVGVAIMSVAISRTSSLECSSSKRKARFASLAHLSMTNCSGNALHMLRSKHATVVLTQYFRILLLWELIFLPLDSLVIIFNPYRKQITCAERKERVSRFALFSHTFAPLAHRVKPESKHAGNVPVAAYRAIYRVTVESLCNADFPLHKTSNYFRQECHEQENELCDTSPNWSFFALSAVYNCDPAAPSRGGGRVSKTNAIAIAIEWNNY